MAIVVDRGRAHSGTKRRVTAPPDMFRSAGTPVLDAAWISHDGDLPIIDGSLIRLHSERLAHTGTAKPLWLWPSATNLSNSELTTIWKAWLRRFDIEYTFRFLNQTLGWTVPQLRNPASADTWTWLTIACGAKALMSVLWT